MSYLNHLIKSRTAFDGWDDMKAAMDKGYVPSIYPRTTADKNLARAIRSRGYNVWDGIRGKNMK